MELRLNTTRGDELGDLEGVGDGGGEHTSKRKGLGPKTKSLAEVTNTNEGVPGPKDQEVKMVTRRRYSQGIYTTTDNGAMGDIVQKRNNRTMSRPNRIIAEPVGDQTETME